uniref:Uncharacterized protein n=1 Tax=Mus spicilegus TaxID=10103 RepID=A0A8C6H562_MUSSI
MFAALLEDPRLWPSFSAPLAGSLFPGCTVEKDQAVPWSCPLPVCCGAAWSVGLQQASSFALAFAITAHYLAVHTLGLLGAFMRGIV